MISFLKTVLSGNFIWGAISGLVAMYIFKPLVDAGLSKLFGKNA